MDPALMGAVITGAFGIVAAAITRGVSVGRQRKRSRATAQHVLDAEDDGEALDAARNGDAKSAVVLAVLDRQMRKNVDCEVKLAQEKKERKADIKRLEAKLEELSGERE